MFPRINDGHDEVDDVARRAELARVALRAEHAQQVLVGVAKPFAVVVSEAVDLLEEQIERFRVAVGQEDAFEDVAEELGDVLVLVHLLDAFGIEQQALVATQALVEQLRPAVFFEAAGEERRLAAELLRLAVHVVHELVDQGDRDLLDLRFRVGHFADEDVARGVDAGFGFSIQHVILRGLPETPGRRDACATRAVLGRALGRESIQ
ncbi:MAG TPA: hypothetical protein VMV69_12420 [Pirellulales bacterium]|nr:hypothetical protein [Pirellulales bacterium]